MAWIGLRVLHPVVVLWHELGHALPALAVSRQPVDLDVGRFQGRAVRLGRLRLRVALSASSGRTIYDASGLSRWTRAGVALGGPVASAGGVGLGLAIGIHGESGLWVRFLGVVLAWAHLRVLLFTCLPERRDPEDPPRGPARSARGADWRNLRSILGGEGSPEH